MNKMNRKILNRDDAVEANKYVHSRLATTGDYNRSPHFFPENKLKVRNILLKNYRNHDSIDGNLKCVDFGCGTGFIIDLVKDLYHEVHGVDITREMMDLVDLSSGNIYLHECLAENTNFSSDTFDMASAYSFMDHLVCYQDFLKEVFRVLKKGGIFYSDLNPNRAFISKISAAKFIRDSGIQISPIVEREIIGSLSNGVNYQKKYGINSKLLENAEPIKSFDYGFDSDEVLQEGYKLGFSKCYVEYEWFLGQAPILHRSKEESRIIETYLNSLAPISSDFFKYLRFIFIK